MAKLQVDIIINPGVFDPIHNYGIVTIKNVATGIDVFSTSYPQLADIYIGPGDYQLIITAKGAVITTMATLNYVPKYEASASTQKPAGGLRVQRVVTSNMNTNEAPLIKKYYYGDLEHLNASSLIEVPGPRYDGYMANPMNCGDGILVCEYTTLNSSSVFTIGLYNNNAISYNSVVESIGENFEGGAIESKFYTTPDAMPENVLNRPIGNAPLSNTASKLNAKPMSETVVKKMPNGSLKTIKKTEYEYNDDVSGEDRIYGFTVVQRVSDALNIPVMFDTTCYTPICGGYLHEVVNYFDIAKYTFFSSWVYPKNKQKHFMMRMVKTR